MQQRQFSQREEACHCNTNSVGSTYSTATYNRQHRVITATKMVDTEAPKAENKKYDITSLNLGSPIMGTAEDESDASGERPHLDEGGPRMVRSAEHLNIA